MEGVCVGTGMAFDPAFYYYRPVNVFAAHGYGPALLAGAEMINLLDKKLLHRYSEWTEKSIDNLKYISKTEVRNSRDYSVPLFLKRS